MARPLKLCMSYIMVYVWMASFSLAQAATYYVSALGNDANSGLNEDSAWQTIEKVNSTLLENSSFVLFRRGDVFRGAISTTKFPSGITFGAYGNGSQPMIKGSVEITGWSPTSRAGLSASVYEADVSALPINIDKGIHHLFVNGELMTLARYPNVDSPADKNWLNVGDTAGTDAFTDSALVAYGKPDNYWAGARLRIRIYSWTYSVFPITEYSAADGKITAPGLGTQKPEWGYFIDDKLEELDHPGEWYYDASAQKVYLYPKNGANPNSLRVEGSTVAIGMSIAPDENETVVENLSFQHFTDYGIKVTAAADCTIRNCSFEYTMTAVYVWNALNVRIAENHLNHQFKTGITLSASSDFSVGNSICEKNTILNSGMFPCYGERYQAAGYQGHGISVFGKAHMVRQNYIEATCHTGIYVKDAGYHVIENNVVRKALSLLNDGGGISIGSSNNIIRGNFLLESIGNVDESNGCASRPTNYPVDPCSRHSTYGMGIGADSRFTGNIIEYNTVANNPDMGIRFNSFTHSVCRNNVIYDNDPQFVLEDKNGESSGNTVEGNIMYSLKPTQLGLSATNQTGTTHHGDIDHNYYGNPYSEVVIKFGDRWYSLGQWMRDFPAYDQNSQSIHYRFPEYSASNVGTNQITNSFFDTDVSGWSGKVSYDPSKTGMDGGSLKAQYLDTVGNLNIIPNVLSIVKDQWYRLKFSVMANNFGNIQLRVNRTQPVYVILEERYFAIDQNRKDEAFIFKASETTDACKILFITKDFDADTYWLDNVTFDPVQPVLNDAAKESVLLMNPTENPKIINLGRKIYTDFDNHTVSGSITLEPYRSTILIHTGERVTNLEDVVANLRILTGTDGMGTDEDGDGKITMKDIILLLWNLTDN